MKKLLKAPVQDSKGMAFITNVIVGGRKGSPYLRARELDFFGFIILRMDETGFDRFTGKHGTTPVYKKVPMAWTEDGGSQSGREEYDLKHPIPRDLVIELLRRGAKSSEAAQSFSICRKEGYDMVEARTIVTNEKLGEELNITEYRFPVISGIPFPLHKIGRYLLLSDFLDPKQVAMRNNLKKKAPPTDENQLELDLVVEVKRRNV